MTSRPCITCGDLIPTGSYCTDCQPDRGPRDHVAWKNNSRWKNLSKRLRRMSPFCEQCSATTKLSVDHILPVSDYPELVYAVENCRVLCLSCNGKRGNRFTPAEAHDVLTRLQAAYKRRPTAKGRERVNVAQRACDQGGYPKSAGRPTGRKAQGAMNSTYVELGWTS